MKLRELYIEHFGKLKEKRLAFSDGINLIYGDNESGKTTVHTCIREMLFGMERARGRAAANDTYSQYEPWERAGAYAGRLKFESGNRTFQISRRFDSSGKNTEIFCEDDGEEISERQGDLTILLDGLTRKVYDNTISIGQLQAQPGQPLAAALNNYAANYYASGDSDLDLQAALETLKKRRKEIDRGLQEEFRKKQGEREKVEQEASFVWREMHRLETEQEALEEEIAYCRETLDAQAEPEPEKNGVIDALRPGKWRVHPLEILAFVVVVALAFVFTPKPWGYLVGVILTLLCLIYVWNRMKVGKKKPAQVQEEATQKAALEKLIWQRERGQEEWKEKQIQYGNLREQLAEMDEVGADVKKQEQKRLALELAMGKLLELSDRMQKQMRVKLNACASEILSRITDGKYTSLVIGEGLKIHVLYEDRKIPVERLSRGTAEQIYLAIRLAAAQVLQEEEQPLLLDDTFVNYDEKRLECTLKRLAESGRQILLFSCQSREETALEKAGIPYRRIEL